MLEIYSMIRSEILLDTSKELIQEAHYVVLYLQPIFLSNIRNLDTFFLTSNNSLVY